MISYRIEETINRPVQEVFPYVADPTLHPKWMDVSDVRVATPGEVRVGTRVRETMKMGSRTIPFTWEVTGYQADTSVAFRTIDGPMSWEGSYEVSPAEGSATRIIGSGRLGLKGWRRIMEHEWRGPARRGRRAPPPQGPPGAADVTTATGLERVCLLLADLSGYTAYVANSEPDHAPAMAGDLVETVVRQLRPTFRLAKLEGDAAFLVAPLDRLDGPMLLDAIDATYDAFRRRLRSITTATTCDCASCSRVPDLDLKFVVHAGSVVRHRVAGREELAGTDAIIAHRLLKADSPAAAGLIRYALLTDATAQALGLDPVALGMFPATERFEHLGEVPVHLLDLEHRTATEGRPWTPPRRAPLVEADLQLQAAPMTVWDQLTSPLLRPSWEGIERVEESTVSGRRGVGTMSACVAHTLASVEEVLEWRPFTVFVRRASIPGVGRLAVRYELTGDGDSTRLQVRWYGPAVTATLAVAQRTSLERLPLAREVDRANR